MNLVAMAGVVCVAIGAWGENPERDQPSGDSRCGVYCLYVSLSLLGKAPDTIEAIEEQLGPVTDRGYSIQQLATAAKRFGVTVMAVQTTPANLVERNETFACISLLNHRHFVLIRDLKDGQAEVLDPPRSYAIPIHTLMSQWDGAALLLSNQPLEGEEELASRLRRSALLEMIIKAALLALLIVVCFASTRTVLRRTRPQESG